MGERNAGLSVIDHRAQGSAEGDGEVLETSRLSPNVHRLEIRARRIAEVGRPGQFVIVRLERGAERIPLTIAGADRVRGSISLIIQAVGMTTRKLVDLAPGQTIRDVAGPLGCPTDLLANGHAVCVGGGVGAALFFPIAQGLRAKGTRLTMIVGARSKDAVLLEAQLAALGQLTVCTDDGSYGRTGTVIPALAEVLSAGGVDVVYACGPVPMMRAVAEATRPYGVRTIVSLNPIMVDGTGMCGGCRVTVAGKMRFACVDGPEFDGHDVDFDELIDRLTMYRAAEHDALCRLTEVAT